MAVYTRVERPELEALLADYRIGVLVGFAGIQGGTANTNYFVTTTDGEYVLTLFEELVREELPFFLELTAHLAEHGIPCAHPVADAAGSYLKTLHGKPAALVARLQGATVERPRTTHCAAVGDLLGAMHLAAADFGRRRDNSYGRAWRRETAVGLQNRLSAADAALLESELRFQDAQDGSGLLRGVIHADLFRDNVLFQEDHLSGVIDFYFACEDYLLLDVAIAVNDWCSRENGELDAARAAALLDAYHARRTLSGLERKAWPAMLRAAALRFWLSRLHQQYYPRPGVITLTKEPEEFRRILAWRVETGAEGAGCWPEGGV